MMVRELAHQAFVCITETMFTLGRDGRGSGAASSFGGILAATAGEPDLCSLGPGVSESDRVTLRNILYTMWAFNSSANGDDRGSLGSASCYLVDDLICCWVVLKGVQMCFAVVTVFAFACRDTE
jgi:hypothetical protein